MKEKVSIIILNWNGWKDTIESLESLYKINYPNYDVVVVDNGSEDESVEMIKKYASGDLKIESNFFEYEKDNKPIKVFEYTNKEAESISKVDEGLYNKASYNKLIFIKNDDDSGFSAGNNIGINFSIKFLNPNYILLLSNDTVVDKDFLDELVTFADKDQKIGVVGPRVFYYDKPDQTAYIGHDVNLCTARISDPHDKLNEGSPSSVKVDYVVGCGLLIKRKVIEDIGLLDPNYFLYYEDCDWCLRAKKQGYGVFYVAKSRIWHKIPIPEIRSLTSLYYGNRNSFLLIKKNRKSGILWCYPILILNKIIFSLYLLIRFKRKESFAVIQAVYDGIKGNYGHKKGFS